MTEYRVYSQDGQGVVGAFITTSSGVKIKFGKTAADDYKAIQFSAAKQFIGFEAEVDDEKIRSLRLISHFTDQTLCVPENPPEEPAKPWTPTITELIIITAVVVVGALLCF